jgi:DNA-binding transcriptional MerR regulator
VKEIQVFEITLRQRELDKRVLSAIAKAIPYKILFILTFEGYAQGWIKIFNTFYHSEWIRLIDMKLRIEGLNLDTVYESIARQVAGGRLDKEAGIVEAVRRDKERQRLTREIVALEKKMLCERQFNRQVEMHNKLKKLRKELEEFKDG